MRLAELSPAERGYLGSPLQTAEALPPLLIHHLGQLLGARMKQRVQIQTEPNPRVTTDFLIDPSVPEIQWDSELDAMWLRGRLGEHGCLSPTRCAAMSQNLLRTLQRGVAETWISLSGVRTLPTALSLRVETPSDKINVTHATLLIRFPSSLTDMNQWAQHIIRHEN